MKQAKRTRLEAAGWEVGDTKECLGLADDEAAMIEVKLQLVEALRTERSSGSASAQMSISSER